MPDFYTPYANPPLSIVVPPGDRDYADQTQKDDCDMNVLFKRYVDGEITQEQWEQRMSALDYLDIPALGLDTPEKVYDFKVKADDIFNSLPATTREMYNNDPAVFFDAAQHLDYNALYDQGIINDDKYADFYKAAHPEEPLPPSSSASQAGETDATQ